MRWACLDRSTLSFRWAMSECSLPSVSMLLRTFLLGFPVQGASSSSLEEAGSMVLCVMLLICNPLFVFLSWLFWTFLGVMCHCERRMHTPQEYGIWSGRNQKYSSWIVIAPTSFDAWRTAMTQHRTTRLVLPFHPGRARPYFNTIYTRPCEVWDEYYRWSLLESG